MSYILKIWQPVRGQPVRRDIAAVVSDVEALEGSPSRPSRYFRPLLESLTFRYPDITSTAGQELPESEWAWSDGPLDAAAQDPVLVLGLRSEKADEVQPFVIQQAAALGLAVLDPQAGMAWFPGDVRIGTNAPERPHQAAAATQRGPTCAETALLLFDTAAPLLSAAGFVPARSKREFRRTFGAGWQDVILMDADDGRGAYVFSLLCTIRLHAVAELHASVFLQALPEKDRQALPIAVLRQQEWLPTASPLAPGDHREYYVKQPAQVAQLREQIVADCSAHLLPLLDACRSLAGLDTLLNTDPLPRSVFFKGYNRRLNYHIWTAYLARNARLEALCQEVLQNVRDPHLAYAAQRCVDHVRTHPLPEDRA